MHFENKKLSLYTRKEFSDKLFKVGIVEVSLREAERTTAHHLRKRNTGMSEMQEDLKRSERMPKFQPPLPENVGLTTKLDSIVAWGRKNSLWPLPFGTACCGIEMMSVMGPKYDLARYGAEVVRFSPRQSDLLLIAGTITTKMAPIVKTIYAQMLEPKYVISMGVCACSGGFYRAYHVLQGVDQVVPVDVYIPGCPPAPEAVLDGIMLLQRMIATGQPRPWKTAWEEANP